MNALLILLLFAGPTKDELAEARKLQGPLMPPSACDGSRRNCRAHQPGKSIRRINRRYSTGFDNFSRDSPRVAFLRQLI